MTRKMSDEEAKRTPLNLRTTLGLRKRLEAAALAEDRSITQEVERRLEQSFEEKPQISNDPLPGIFSGDVRTYLRNHRPTGHFLEMIADSFMHISRVMRERGRDELEIRTALRAAVISAMHWHLWRGESAPAPEGPAAAPGTRKPDLPPATLGSILADERNLWLGMWGEPNASADTLDGRITNVWSGDGTALVYGPTREEIETERVRMLSEAKAAEARGDIRQDRENLHLYKPVEIIQPTQDDEAATPTPPARSVKEIMGR